MPRTRPVLILALLLLTACGPAAAPAESLPAAPATPAPTHTSPAPIAATGTPRPAATPWPTSTPVDVNASIGLYFVGSELVDLLALSKARCVQDLYSYYPGKIGQVMDAKGLSQPEAVNDICAMPVTACANIPAPYGRFPILGLGEAWAPGLTASRFAGSYQNVPPDEFVPGVEYCFMDLGLYLVMQPRGDSLADERPSLCPDSSRVGFPSVEEQCWFAVFTLPFEDGPVMYSGLFTGDYYILDKVPAAEWEYTLTGSLSSRIGRYPGTDILKVWEYDQNDLAQWIVYFEIPDDPFLLQLGWDPLWIEYAP